MVKQNQNLSNTSAPVLFLIFNRPDTTQLVFNEIRKSKPGKLYIAADGPRQGHKEDMVNCQLARDIVKQVDWDCELKTRFLDNNLGCGPGVSSAISWVFENEDKIIILEDDCKPSQAFFHYCQEMLNRYEDDLRVWMISGTNHFLGKKNLVQGDSYFFSKYAAIWGWATWANRWNKTNLNMNDFEKFNQNNYIFDHVNRPDGKVALKRLRDFYEKMQHTKPTTWDAQWGFTIWANRGMGIVPAQNLITNVGVIGTHAAKAVKNAHQLPANEYFVCENHPDFIQTNHIYDDEYYKVFRKRSNIFKRIVRKMFRLSNRVFDF